MSAPTSTVFLLDVDNTLLDNDAVEADLHRHLAAQLGQELTERYWTIFEELRSELGYADYLGGLERLRATYPHEPRLLEVSTYLVEYPFDERVYPGALETVRRLNALGRPVVLSDGDAVFQPHKIRRSGVWAAVAGPCSRLRPQRARAQRRRATLSGRPLRHRRRQASYPRRGQALLEEPGHDGLSPTGPLRR